MAEFQKSKKLSGLLFSRVTLLVLIIISVVLVVALFGIIPKERITNRNKDMVLNQLDSLKNQSSLLETEIGKLKTNDGIEEKIREKFRVVKEGEQLVVIVDDQKISENIPTQKTGSLWSLLKNLFK
jgi:cell division protein FtsB